MNCYSPGICSFPVYTTFEVVVNSHSWDSLTREIKKGVAIAICEWA